MRLSSLLLRSCVCAMFSAVLSMSSAGAQTASLAGCKPHASETPEADAALYLEDWAKASRLYREVLKKDPASLEARAGLVRTMLGQAQIDDALKESLVMVSQHEASVAAQTVLGETYVRRGELTPAAPVLSRALALDPCYARAHLQEARLQQLSGYRASAAKQLAQAHALDSEDEQITVAWLFSLPPATRYPMLKDFVAKAKYLNAEDREDLRSEVLEGEARMKSHCTVSSPAQGTKVHFVVDSTLSRAPSEPTIDATMNGKVHRMALSTSSNELILPRATANRMGLLPVVRYTYSLPYGSGRFHYYLANLASLHIGEVEYRDCLVTVRDEDYLDDGLYNPNGTDATLGTLFLADFLVGLDTPKRELALTPLPPPSPKVDGAGLPTWSDVSASNGAAVPSINGGEFGQYNRTIPQAMTGWASLVQYRGFLWVPTHIGGGPAVLFQIELAEPWPRISTVAVKQAGKIEALTNGKTILPFRGNFLEFAGHFVPVNSWTSVRYDEYNKHLRLETSGTIGGEALRQLNITMDLRDDLAQFMNSK